MCSHPVFGFYPSFTSVQLVEVKEVKGSYRPSACEVKGRYISPLITCMIFCPSSSASTMVGASL